MNHWHTASQTTHFTIVAHVFVCMSLLLGSLLKHLNHDVPKLEAAQHRHEHYVTYNPLSIVREGRTCAIANEFQHVAVVALNGTRTRQVQDLAISNIAHKNFNVFHAGYPHGGNKHTGVALMFNKKFIHSKHIHSFAFPEDIRIQGRCIAIRVKRNQSDVCHMSLYFPPYGTKGAMSITKSMLSWATNVFQKLPLRCLPMMYMDTNSGFGIEKSEGGIISGIDTSACGEHNLAVENPVGIQIRIFLEKWKMFLTLTANKQEPTYYSVCRNNNTSHIDHIAVPLSMWADWQLNARTNVWIQSGRKLQLIKHASLADHMPVAFTARKCFYIVKQKPTHARINRDEMMRCMLYGHKRKKSPMR